MLKPTMQLVAITCLCLSLFGCATNLTPREMSELSNGRQYFEDGYYKQAIHRLFPLAVNGNAEAQYAVGYMYYYGYGVSQDTDMGYFWIKRSADQGYPQATSALQMISHGATVQPQDKTAASKTPPMGS